MMLPKRIIKERKKMEYKFEVGDTVTGTERNTYSLTNKNMIGVITRINPWNGNIDIKITSHKQYEKYIGNTYTGLTPCSFELVKSATVYPKIVYDGLLKIVWNPPYTIIEETDMWGHKRVGKTECVDGDTYDERQGYMYALAKMNMSSHMKRYFRGKEQE